MAVIPMWKCDRDGVMFTSKRDADEYDKMLETGEALSAAIRTAVPALAEAQAMEIGLFLSRNRDAVVKALKGSAEELSAALAQANTAETADESAEDSSRGLRAVS